MKFKHLTFIISLLTAFSASAQKVSFGNDGQRTETLYYKNGGIKRVAVFGKKEGEETVTGYYPNGKLYYSVSYSPAKTGLIKKYNECRDTAGNAVVKDGNGYWVRYSDDFKHKFEQGKTIDGLADSVWRIAFTDSVGELDTYKKGVLVHSEMYPEKKEGADITNPAVPQFVNGVRAFYTFLAKKIRYPAVARELDVTGRVFISFTVEKDGTVNDVDILDGVGAGCEEEAARVLKLSPNWQPGMKDGQPVAVQFVVPITFSLSRE